MQSFNYILELFKKYNLPFKLSQETETVQELKVIRVVVSKEHVVKGHVETYLKVIAGQEKKKKRGRNSIVILFEGYENDHRKMYEVPEIKSWVQRLVKNKPHLFYFMVNVNDNYLRDLAFCLVNPETAYVPPALQSYVGTQSSLTLNGADVIPTLRKITESTFSYAKKLKHTPEEILDACSLILNNTNYDEYYQKRKMSAL
jgi:hypothetical protein